MISVSNLEKSFGDRVLFTGASFQLNPGERYGLVGGERLRQDDAPQHPER
jgi:ATPase subunit of ABC transporter with duplicated ATPase domains